MAVPYLCPMCRRNRARFSLSYAVSLEIRKAPQDGRWLWQADEVRLASRRGRPDVKVKCLECDYEAPEAVFSKAARRSVPPQPTPGSAAGAGPPRVVSPGAAPPGAASHGATARS